ncbi:MAG: hypothetical protein KF746_15675 [Chitinophagaceae bacterium]|nr:hypothetical protein [Chitinophagaceae bacterium]
MFIIFSIRQEPNHVRLSKDAADPVGLLQLIVSVDYDNNDELILNDFKEQTCK